MITTEQIILRNRINSLSIAREEFDDTLLFVKLDYGSLGHLTTFFQLKGIYISMLTKVSMSGFGRRGSWLVSTWLVSTWLVSTWLVSTWLVSTWLVSTCLAKLLPLKFKKIKVAITNKQDRQCAITFWHLRFTFKF